MMTWPYKVGAVVMLLIAVFAIGYVKGNSAGRVQQLQDTVEAYQKREGIDNAVSSVDKYRVCVDLGGDKDECRLLNAAKRND